MKVKNVSFKLKPEFKISKDFSFFNNTCIKKGSLVSPNLHRGLHILAQPVLLDVPPEAQWRPPSETLFSSLSSISPSASCFIWVPSTETLTPQRMVFLFQNQPLLGNVWEAHTSQLLKHEAGSVTGEQFALLQKPEQSLLFSPHAHLSCCTATVCPRYDSAEQTNCGHVLRFFLPSPSHWQVFISVLVSWQS